MYAGKLDQKERLFRVRSCSTRDVRPKDIDEMIKKLIETWKLKYGNITFWVCGPPPMVEAMEKVLGSVKVTSDKLRTEKFTGY